jgi:hypothetical protein
LLDLFVDPEDGGNIRVLPEMSVNLVKTGTRITYGPKVSWKKPHIMFNASGMAMCEVLYVYQE